MELQHVAIGGICSATIGRDYRPDHFDRMERYCKPPDTMAKPVCFTSQVQRSFQSYPTSQALPMQRAAAELLEVVKDFPFYDADRSAWLALVLSLIGRSAIAGCVPLFGITANCRGSGKSLLADAASLIAYGRHAPEKHSQGMTMSNAKRLQPPLLKPCRAFCLITSIAY